jgi:hypothetical protein
MAKRNLFEYRVVPSKDKLTDGFEAGFTWSGFPPPTTGIAYGRTTTNPFAGNYCGYIIDQRDDVGCGVYKAGLNLMAPVNVHKFAVRYVGNFPNDTWEGYVYLYAPDVAKISTIITIGGGGTVKYLDATGTHTLYAGTASQWYYFVITETWGTRKFDLELYNQAMTLLVSVTNKDMAWIDPPSSYWFPPLLFYTSIAQQGYLYFDEIDIDP